MKEIPMVSFEGLDGAGKTTQTQRLKEVLGETGLKVLLLTSPSKSLVGRIIRANLSNIIDSRKSRLFAYDFRRSSRQINEDYDLVIWDRHIDSIYTSNQEIGILDVEHDTKGIPRPNKVVLLDITPEVSWQRECTKSDHPLNIQWLRMKYQRYRELLEKEPERFEVIDAARSVDEVFKEIIRSMHNFLKDKGK